MSAEVGDESQNMWLGVEAEVEFCRLRGCSWWRLAGRRERRIERLVINSESVVGGGRGGRVGQVSLVDGWREKGAVGEVVGSVSLKPVRKVKRR